MRSARVALYDIQSGNFEDIRRKAETGMLPLLQQSDGFVSYGVARIDEKAFMSLSTWETRAQAHAATTKAADWVGANAEGHYTLRESHVGDLSIDAGAPLTAPITG
jgi:heme-degrading monooxygenase HmoA